MLQNQYRIKGEMNQIERKSANVYGLCVQGLEWRFLRLLASLFLVFLGPVALRITSSLGDHDTVSVTLSRNERHKTTILVGTTDAFGARGELDCQLLRALARRSL